MMRALRVVKIAALQLALLLATIAALDAVLFFALPNDLVARFPTYRENTFIVDVIGRGYPQDYFEAHPERGFDIKPTDTPRTDQIHRLDDVQYNVWSNAIGCFDKPVADLKDRFWYMAGDSIAWGHAKFEDLMGTIIEQQEGVALLQCGVTHTGQRHQFSKFLEITKKLGKTPERVLVFYSPTDTANDYAYPHSIVKDGGLADTRMLGENNEIVAIGDDWFAQMKAEREAAKVDAEGIATAFSPRRFLMKYSLSAQLLNAGLHAADRRFPWIGRNIGMLGDDPTLDWYDKYFRYNGTKIYDIHRMTYFQTQNGRLAYTDFPYADRNKEVIRQWRDHARASNYRLEFVLSHPGPSRVYEDISVTNFYKEFIAFLDAEGIKYYDLVAELEKREIETDDLYWEEDLHMSGRGNRIVGRILSELL
jgi:hypothetical protein